MTINDVKRLEQENAELKGTIDAYKMSENEANEIIAELKHTLDCKNGTIETLKAENARLKEENEKLNKMTGIFSARLCEKYRTTLQEIKAIAEDRTKTYDYLLGQEYTDLVDNILDLITKAESEEE